MKFHYILPCLIAFLFSGILPSIADSISTANLCPEGCFCLNNGYTEFADKSYIVKDCKEQKAKSYMATNSGFSYGNIVSVYSGESNTWQGHKNVYKYEDFSEFYKGTLGFYGIINGGFIHYNACGSYDSTGNCAAKKYDLFQCPETYPYSAKGSKSLSDCFKYDANGNKIYYGSTNYGNCNIDAVRATVQNLQQALIKAAQDLQRALENTTQYTNGGTLDLGAALGQTGTQYTNGGTLDLGAALGQTETQNITGKKNPQPQKFQKRIEIDAQTETPKRAASQSGPFRSNILNTYAGAN